MVLTLILGHLADVLDTDGLIVTAEPSELDEPDWDAIAKDRRLEAEGLL